MKTSLALAAVLLLASPAAAQYVEVTPPASAVTATTNDGNLPGNTVDDSLATRWSGNGDGASIRFDLGAPQTVGYVRLAVHQGNTRKNVFDLQTSVDGTAWTTRLSAQTSGTTTALEAHDFDDVSARYVRYLGHGYAGNDGVTGTWNSLLEVQIFAASGPPAPTPTPTPTPVAATPTPTPTPGTGPVDITPGAAGVSASTSDTNVPANAVDKSLATRWSGNGIGAWLRLDLGAARTVGYLRIAFHQGDTRQFSFDLQTSADGTAWSTVWTGQSGGTTNSHETFDFTDVSARYVRYYGRGNTVNPWSSLTEIEVWSGGGAPAATPTPTSTPTPTPIGPTPTPTSTPTPTPTTPPGSCSRTVNVTPSTYASAVAGAQPGDCLVLANGTYTGAKITAKGTAANKIVIRAASRLGATFTGQTEFSAAEHVTLEGVVFTGTSTQKVTSSSYVRITRCRFQLGGTASLKWLLLQGAGNNHTEIDHCEFGPKSTLGNFITIDGSATQASQYDWIHHNYFHDIGPRAANEMEAIRMGWSAISMSNAFTTLEHNLFVNCDGDPEIISVKSCRNVVRYNTIRASQGALSLRHGNFNDVYGNFILGGNRTGTGGIRVYGQDHRIFNNYVEGVTGSGFDAPLALDGGDVDTSGALSSHWRVYRARVVNNTWVNNTFGIEIGKNYSLAPVDCTIANNIVKTSGQLVTHWKAPVNMTYQGNIGFGGPLGITASQAQWWIVDPLFTLANGLQKLGSSSPAINASAGVYAYVTDDMDGQARAAAADIGADEYSTAAVSRRPLTTSDVGPNAP